jgi:hypothetical protein
MEKLDVEPQINTIISIEENMNCQAILCLEHIVTIRLHNYKCILREQTKETQSLHKDTFNQDDLN